MSKSIGLDGECCWERFGGSRLFLVLNKGYRVGMSVVVRFISLLIVFRDLDFYVKFGF